MSLNKAEVDFIVDVYQDLTDSIKRLQAQRAELTKDLPVGRTDGTLKGFRVSPHTTRSTIDLMRLREYVTKQVLDRCRVSRRHKGAVKLVDALKPKKAKTKGVTNES